MAPIGKGADTGAVGVDKGTEAGAADDTGADSGWAEIALIINMTYIFYL
jgi:hypothetical protein